MTGKYERYDIEPETTPDIVKVPSRFRVKVKRHKLIGLILKETIETRGNMGVVMSRPCVYGVFGRPVGGLAPIHDKCVGCLRCTVQYPGVVQIHRNPERARLGDSYLTPDMVDTLLYEARTGRVPVRGAGFRGKFGGPGWDGMWLDMSEIVRPTRDGIHGREFISTSVDIGTKPAFLTFDDAGRPTGELPNVVSLQVPFVFDMPPAGAPRMLAEILAETAREIGSLSFARTSSGGGTGALGPAHIVPVVSSREPETPTGQPPVIALDGFEPDLFSDLQSRFPASLICARVPADADVLAIYEAGARMIHLIADFHGRAGEAFLLDLIRAAHGALVDAGLRERVTLIGGGGIVMAEHVAKAIACGLDAVSIDTASWAALQAGFEGEIRDRDSSRITFPKMTQAWGKARLRNQAACWRDQLLEVMGAMGMREVRRLRGETGRVMFQADLERDAFGDIEGFEARV